MFQLLVLAAVIYVLYRWLRRGAAPLRRERPAGRPPASAPVEEMVQDPACGTWVPLSQALTSRRGGETLHFCSAECRDKYLKEKNY
jgi:YHS domain-containing protein